MSGNRQWRLARRPGPDETIGPAHFTLDEGRIPDIGDGEMLVRTVCLGTSPAQRAYTIENRRFHGGVEIGDVMHGRGVGVVEASRHPEFAPGDWVAATLGWQEWSVQRTGQGPKGGVDVLSVQKLDPSVGAASLHLGVLGNAGFTALFGLQEIGGLQDIARSGGSRPAAAGKTVLVSAAAGGVGSLAGQIAAAYGARVIGIAGGAAKCAWIQDRAGYVGAIDYKSEDVGAGIDRLCPHGVDLYFDNVGGAQLDTVLQRIAVGARVVLCGMISTEYLAQRPPGPAWYTELLYRRARMEGFVVWDHVARFPEFFAQLRALLEAGKIGGVEDISHGLETMPSALESLFTGANRGVRLVQVSPDP